MKINKFFLPLLFFLCIALGVIIGSYSNFYIETNSGKKNYKAKLNKLINFIDKEYVDDIKTDSIVDLTVTNILSNLDPHSVYVPPNEQTAVAESMQGNFVGIGINYYNFKDSVAVIMPIKNGPAAKAGIKAGDRILYANNYKLFGKKINNDTLYKKLRGKQNSAVTLTLYRKSEKRILKKTIIRDKIALHSLDVSILINKTTGYIKLNRFAENTETEFHNALLQLKKNKITSLIIDLRENGGGYMQSAIAVADELLKDNELIVFTKSKNGSIDKTFATKKGDFETGKLTVLIDENSASASEILAGAIQDNDRGLVVGRRSFGKGLVQREMDFDDGSAVRLTIARYYTPSGRSIQKPYIKGQSDDYYKESENRFNTGELYLKNKIKIADSLKFKTKKGRIVYGGGGIVPDVFVPLEANKNNEKITQYLQTGLVGHFVFEQLDNNYNQFKTPNFEIFKTKMLQKDFSAKFSTFLDKMQLKININKNKNLVNRYIVAEFARQLFDDAAYYKIILKDDAMLKMALKK